MHRMYACREMPASPDRSHQASQHNRPPPLEDPVQGIPDQMAARERAVPLKMIKGWTSRREANHQDPLRGEARPSLLSDHHFALSSLSWIPFSLLSCESVLLAVLIVEAIWLHSRELLEEKRGTGVTGG
jgi:hypothetical protein